MFAAKANRFLSVLLAMSFIIAPGALSSFSASGFAEGAARAVETGGLVRVQVEFKSESAVDITSFCVQVAEVEVDPETGQVKVRRFVNAVDSGTILNPIGYRGQVCGGVVQGLGYALVGEMAVEESRGGDSPLGDAKIPDKQDRHVL